MSARDLAAELKADAEARELEALREMRDALLGAYDINGEVKSAHAVLFFDKDGNGPCVTLSGALISKLTRLAQKAKSAEVAR